MEKKPEKNEEEMKIPYVSVLTDFGFKRCFGNSITMRSFLCDLDTHEEFWDRMRKYFILLSKFDSATCQEWTIKEAWLDTIKNIGMTNEIDPRVYEVADEGLLALIEKAKVAALSPEEYALYLSELKAIGDASAPEWYGYERGKKEGIQEGILQESLRYAKELKDLGIPIEAIMKVSHLSREEILTL